jgi:hypothetical protein
MEKSVQVNNSMIVFLSKMVFSFALEYAISKVQGNKAGLKWNGTHTGTLTLVLKINVK